MTPEQIASLASSLKDNEAFQLALDKVRLSAVDALILSQPSKTEDIIRYQSTVAVVDDIRANLEQFIRSGQPKKPAGIA